MPRWLFVILLIIVGFLLLSLAAFVTVPWILQALTPQVGTVLIYEIDEENPSANARELATRTADAFDRRLNSAFARRARVRLMEDNRIEVGVYGDDPAKMRTVADIVEANGKLEFRIVANVVKHKTEIERARKEPEKTVFLDSSGQWSARWARVNENVKLAPLYNAVRKREILGKEVTEVLIVRDPYDVTGDFIATARPGSDNGRPNVEITFTRNGGRLFGMLTAENSPDTSHPDLKTQLAIILDDEVCSAPNILTTITDRAQITGNFTDNEVKHVADCLNAGRLPVSVRRVEERKVETK